MDFYRTPWLHLQNSLLFKAYEIFAKTVKLEKFLKSEIIQSTFSDHSTNKPEINNKKITSKAPYVWKLRSVFLNKRWIKKELMMEIRKYFN